MDGLVGFISGIDVLVVKLRDDIPGNDQPDSTFFTELRDPKSEKYQNNSLDAADIKIGILNSLLGHRDVPLREKAAPIVIAWVDVAGRGIQGA